ncbi:MAG: T9SS type A sorting domain-containing protein [Bacteroidetes bacterium]|nr:T9SS type A sorting domain-containing protein [Bacteroidota bacterium]
MRSLLLLVLGSLVGATAFAQTTIVVNVASAATGDYNPSDGHCDVDASTIGDQCTFYAALYFANSFSDPPSVPVRITFALAEAPPVFEVRGFTFYRPVELDCSTQGGFRAGYPQIAIQNTGFESSVFTFRGGNSVVRGCAFPFAPTSILTFVDAGHNVIEGNTFGLNRDGTSAIGDGIVQAVNLNIGSGGPSNGNRVGGISPSQYNVFGRFGSANSGLAGRGVLIGSDSNYVAGNYFGLDPTGLEARSGYGPGINLYLTATANRIGDPAAPNVLGNTTGIAVAGSSGSGLPARNNVIEGNTVGFLADHRTAVPGFAPPFTASGISLSAFDGGTLTGTTVRGNTVAAFPVGIRVSGDGVSATLVESNAVGTNRERDEARPNTTGILVEGGSATIIRDNTVSGNTSAGIAVQRGSFQAAPVGVVIEGNRIGTDGSGTLALPNGYGVTVSGGAGSVLIGGRTAVAANTISGNRFAGIHITSGSVGGNRIEGNRIGLNAIGMAALPNQNAGVLLASARSNVVGGVDAGVRNVISGNLRGGVMITGSAATGNLVSGNWIGLSGDGTSAIGNGQYAIQLVEAPDNIIGGAGLIAANTISGNSGGLYIQQSPRTIVFGNRFGVGGTGAGRIPNGGAAVTVFQSNDTQIGALTASEGNRFAFHLTSPAVQVLQSTGVAILSNTFDRNGMGIDLGGDGPTANDVDDPDTGANRLMNTPIIASAAINRTTGNLDVTYSVNAASSNATYSLTVQFYLADSTGVQGAYFLVSDTYVFPNTSRSVSLPTGLGSEFLTEGRVLATATDQAGNTSEFSPSVAAVLVAAEGEAAPEAFALGRPWPQPAVAAATVAVALPAPGRLRVEVFDLLGRRLAVPFDGEAAAGRLPVRIDTRGWASGMYLVQAQTDDQTLTQPLVVR